MPSFPLRSQLPNLFQPLLLVLAGISLFLLRHVLFKGTPYYVSSTPFKRTRAMLFPPMRRGGRTREAKQD